VAATQIFYFHGALTPASRSRLPARRHLRAQSQPPGVHCRMLYFFHGTAAIIVSHGLIKEREVPPREIDLAIRRKDNSRRVRNGTHIDESVDSPWQSKTKIQVAHASMDV